MAANTPSEVELKTAEELKSMTFKTLKQYAKSLDFEIPKFATKKHVIIDLILKRQAEITTVSLDSPTPASTGTNTNNNAVSKQPTSRPERALSGGKYVRKRKKKVLKPGQFLASPVRINITYDGELKKLKKSFELINFAEIKALRIEAETDIYCDIIKLNSTSCGASLTTITKGVTSGVSLFLGSDASAQNAETMTLVCDTIASYAYEPFGVEYFFRSIGMLSFRKSSNVDEPVVLGCMMDEFNALYMTWLTSKGAVAGRETKVAFLKEIMFERYGVDIDGVAGRQKCKLTSEKLGQILVDYLSINRDCNVDEQKREEWKIKLENEQTEFAESVKDFVEMFEKICDDCIVARLQTDRRMDNEYFYYFILMVGCHKTSRKLITVSVQFEVQIGKFKEVK